MTRTADGYYFMFEIGWFIDLLIPTMVRVKNGTIFLVGSTAAACKNLKPCCMPCGGATEVKQLNPDDPAVKAFKTVDSLIPVQNPANLEAELEKVLSDPELRTKYLHARARMQREATPERVQNDYEVLCGLDGHLR